jgi:proline iminopeptidase
MKHPERVTELVLRGIFLLRDKEIQWFYQAGADVLFPDVWEIYKNAIPPAERSDYLTAYHKRLTGQYGREEMKKAAVAWSVWEGKTSNLIPPPDEDVVAKHGAEDFSLAFARIENHYFMNKGFFPRDGFLLEKEQIDRIRHIPTFIVQGRYDVVCPMMSAYDLHKAFPEAEFKITITGHSGFEPDIIHELVSATDRFKYNYTA